MTNKEKDTVRQAIGKAANDALQGKPERTPLTEVEYFEVVNKLLATASPIGGYCLAFVEVLRRKRKGISPPVEMLEEFARCESIAEGLGKYEECLKYMERSA